MAGAGSPRRVHHSLAMLYVTQQERLTLTMLGAAALAALGILLWQQHRPPVRIEAGATPPSGQWNALLTQAKQIDLNTATAQELERLPEIGPALAQRIVAHRAAQGPFRRAEDLLQVPGIGPKTYEALGDSITVR